MISPSPTLSLPFVTLAWVLLMENCLTINKYNSLSGPQTETGMRQINSFPTEGIYLCSNWAWQQGEDTHFQTAPYESRGRCRPHERKFLHILYLINLSKFCSCLLLYFLYAWFKKKTFSVVITQWRKVCWVFFFFFQIWAAWLMRLITLK